MTFICHSSAAGLSPDGIKSDFPIPWGEAITKPVIDVAVEPFDILALIDALQEVLKGTPKHVLSIGVGSVNTG